MKNNYGLVLSGGGTKGAYEVGAWKAIKELGIPIGGIAGTSIGALNGALFLQDDEEKTYSVYNNIQMSDIFGTLDSIDQEKSLFSVDNIRGLMKEYVQQKGLDTAPLENLIHENVDVDKVYDSPLDFGIVAFSLKDFAPVEKFKEEMTRDSMVKYLLASASFPIFKPMKVKGDQFVDGGVYDNMPINMLIQRGYKKIIVIDVVGLGLRRKIENRDGILIKMIRCSEDLGGTFDFDKQRIAKNIQMGYLDTLKAFQDLQGHIYYFSRDTFNKLSENFSLNTIYGLETAAKFYKLERYQIYSFDSFLTQIWDKHKSAQELYHEYNRKGFLQKLIETPLQVFDLVEKGYVIAWFEDMIATWPGQDTNPIVKFFDDYLQAAKAMVELRNFFLA